MPWYCRLIVGEEEKRKLYSHRPPKKNSKDCLLVIGHLYTERHGFRAPFTNIVMLHCFIFPSAMQEEGKAKAFSGTCSKINNRNTNEFNTFFLSIQKLKPDLSHLTLGMAIFFSHLIPSYLKSQFLYSPPANQRVAHLSSFFVSSLILASC